LEERFDKSNRSRNDKINKGPYRKGSTVNAWRRAVFLLIAACISCPLAKSDVKQGWIDTIPPVVTIQPRETYHARIFLANLSSNEPGDIWFSVAYNGKGRTPDGKMEPYRNPITVIEEGKTTVYFYGEDLAGNKSRLDSMEYVLDTHPPELAIAPGPGRYRTKITVRVTANKPCRFLFHSVRGDTAGKAVAESLTVNDSIAGFISATDKAGNTSFSPVFSYTVDSRVVQAVISPKEGIYNKQQKMSLTANAPADIFYSFDPSAPSGRFSRFDKPVPLPYGNTIVRYYAKGNNGWESDIIQATYVIDTIAPRVHLVKKTGAASDTLVLSTKKPSSIRFTLDNRFPTEESALYERPLIVQHRGKCVVKAIAKDRAGNVSDVFEWTYKFETNPPVISLSKPPGLYNSVIRVHVMTDKPASIFYTLDGDAPTANSTLYKDDISISKDGTTKLRLIALDEAGNTSPETEAEYTVDTRPPDVRVRVEENVKENVFLVTLTADEEARIYYETGDAVPTLSSPVFKDKVPLHMGQALKYFAVDLAGNRTPVKVMDDLKRPLVSAFPPGGTYNRRLRVVFSTSAGNQVFWRIPPDTAFKPYSDTVYFNKEGVYSLEYYSETGTGLKSPIRRNEYTIDMTPPHVTVSVKKGVRDSISVFFESSKNATIYYTTDGSSPAYSATTRTLANKFLRSQDRLSIVRRADVKLAFFAEDVAGNQSAITVLDVFKPLAVPNVPSGRDILYDRILSISLNTYDDRSQIFYSRHGHTPTTDSSVFTGPITLVNSDTIVAFVIDAAGYRGQLDTFVYLIDLPPSPRFTVSPDSVFAGTAVHFDASATIDHETPSNKLVYRWDFMGTGKFDTEFKADPRAQFSYPSPGVFKPALEVKDENKRTAAISKEVLVRSLCPQGMVSIALPGERTLCMDRYEWPNLQGEKPTVNVSWVEAKMLCIEAGKRLCTPDEWTGACKGLRKTAYPYGNTYENQRCPDRGDGLYKSGSFRRCVNDFGVYDMVGNVWEWVDGKKGDYPLLKGGSFNYGESADCNVVSQGSVGTKSSEAGFRCCK
jgi:Sulfatase-modifying factor enzyme 1/Chitobiase/beta-hexosaminidase C-terminal domain